MTPTPGPTPLGEHDAARIERFLEGLPVGANRDLFASLLASVVDLATSGTDRLDMKIASAAVAEMAMAFEIFAPYRDVPKVTIFGSARTRADDPLYAQARDLAAALAARGWMVTTGAGPGIMAAGVEGAGRDRSFGINIRLPFEQGANQFIANDPKLIEMKYFFTRKLMLMKESDGFVALPGGFGTLDETYELLTLMQTGKSEPYPIVLLEVPGGGYWRSWERFVHEEVAKRGLIDAEDCALYRITDSTAEAVDEILGFYRNYHSRRFVGALLVMRLRAAPTDAELEQLNNEFGDIVEHGRIERTAPLPPEVRGHDHLALPRIAFTFDRVHHGRLRSLINALNALPSAPPAHVAGTREQVAGGQPMEADLRARAQEEGDAEA